MADEGMWMPQQVPELVEKLTDLGLKIDARRFADLTGDPMGAIVSTGGCSAAFVSPIGLIVTNHHCAYSALQFNSTPQRNLLQNGFLARTLTEEIQATPDFRIYVTTSIEDVTDKIVGKLSSRLTNLERERTIARRQKEMIGTCEKEAGTRCLVPAFFEGAQYLRISQMEVRDVRLVYAPAVGIGNYGGEVDNWMWPRHTGDFAFLRAYVGADGKAADFSAQNVPYRPKHYLKVSVDDIDPGDLMIVAGYPGKTFRYRTAEEVRDAQEYSYPTSIRYRKALLEILENGGKNNKEVEISNASRIRSLANYLKKYEGTLDAFRKGSLMSRRQEEEAKLLSSVDEAAAEKQRQLMEEFAAVLARPRATRERDTLLEWLYIGSPMLWEANKLVKLSVERARKDLDRDPGYQERDFAKLRLGLIKAQKTLEPGSDRAGLRYFLMQATKLPSDQRIKAVDDALAATGGKEPSVQIEKFLDRLYGSTQIGNLKVRQVMFEESTGQLMDRRDSILEFAGALRKLGDEIELNEEQTSGAMSRLRPQYVEAVKKLRGGLLAPDANGTLRVSFGIVAGYTPRESVIYSPQTTVEGILEKDTGQEPFNSPKELLTSLERRTFGPYIDPELGGVPVNFLSKGDITNGSSGSATLNARGELCGLAFDGNYEAMGSDYVVNPDLSRAIHVDSRYMIWVMDAVDGAHNLIREMGLPVHFEK